MPLIVVRNLNNKSIPVRDVNMTVLEHMQFHRIDWMHACGGKGRCTTCKFIVVEGMQRISEETHAEHQYRQKGALKSNERLACQAKIKGDIIIRVPEASKLPHITYSA